MRAYSNIFTTLVRPFQLRCRPVVHIPCRCRWPFAVGKGGII